MLKKFKDLTEEEMKNICDKHTEEHGKCGLYNIFHCPLFICIDENFMYCYYMVEKNKLIRELLDSIDEKEIKTDA